MGTSIAIAYDGSVEAARALASFAATGLSGGRTVHVIAAADVADRPHTARHVERAIAFLKNHDINATSHIVESGREPAEVILKQAQHLDAGLLVMGAFGQSAIREFFLGSVTRQVLKESSIPVFCYR